MAVDLTPAFISAAGVIIAALLVYLATRQKTLNDSAAAKDRINSDATMAREKILADATAALQEQQSRYILDLQNQAAVVNLRLQDVDTKLQAAQAAIIQAFAEKAEVTLQLKTALFELGEVHAKLSEARLKLSEALAANTLLLDQIKERLNGSSKLK